jgi:hypothetical protein
MQFISSARVQLLELLGSGVSEVRWASTWAGPKANIVKDYLLSVTHVLTNFDTMAAHLYCDFGTWGKEFTRIFHLQVIAQV